jgi:hypothetical protein
MDFLRNESEIPIPRIRLMVKKSVWDEYLLTEIDGIKYIQGKDTITKERTAFEFELLDSPLVLWDLIELKTKLSDEIFTIKQSYINDQISDNDIALILSFCSKYGLPFWNIKPTAEVFINYEDSITKETPTPAEVNIFHDIIPFADCNSFPVSSFIVGLLYLHRDFLSIIAANNWEDDEMIYSLLSSKDLEQIEQIRKRQAKRHTVSLLVPRQHPYYTYWNDTKMALQLRCNNIMHLASYHLCAIQQSQDYTSGNTLKICPKCKQLFIAKTPQQKFCNNPCTRQAYYSSKKRKK